jgi:hypothetical protein
MQHDHGILYGAMLGIVDDAANRSEDGGEGGEGAQQWHCETNNASETHRISDQWRLRLLEKAASSVTANRRHWSYMAKPCWCLLS